MNLLAGLCNGHPHPEWWLDETHRERHQARAYCKVCPVRDECRAHEADGQPVCGLAGGLTMEQRGRAGQVPMKAAERRDRGSTCVVCGSHLTDRGQGHVPLYCPEGPCRRLGRKRREQTTEAA